MSESKHALHVKRNWYDNEPERLTVSVESSASTGERFAVFTTSCTWLSEVQVDQLIDYLQYCKTVMNEVDTPVS
jgi:hypothetical protein